MFSRCGTSNGKGFMLCHVQIYVNYDSREIQGLIPRRVCGREQLRKRNRTKNCVYELSHDQFKNRGKEKLINSIPGERMA